MMEDGSQALHDNKWNFTYNGASHKPNANTHCLSSNGMYFFKGGEEAHMMIMIIMKIFSLFSFLK